VGVQSHINIGVKAPTPGKIYLLDVYAKGNSSIEHCSHCAFAAEGPDGQLEFWDMTGDWQQLYFTTYSDDTDCTS
jgi:hypothetical protein